MKKKVFGVGVNDANYIVKRNKAATTEAWSCPYYDRWKDMLRRCYSPLYQAKQPTYIGCTVCDEWLYFSKFKEWMLQQDWEGKQLDKDLLITDNKLYSPDTCLFVSKDVNTALLIRQSDRGEYPLGVSFDSLKGVLMSCISIAGNGIHLGYFTDELLAHKCWQVEKVKHLMHLADEQSDSRVKAALMVRVKHLRDDIANNKITEKL